MQIGLGVLINQLWGNRGDVDALRDSFGKIIASATITDDALWLRFSDGAGVRIYDDGQTCCESRYITTDDDLPYYTGATFVCLELADGPTINDQYGDPHEQQFLKVTTSKGIFVCVTHNEHNGYYGGFWVKIAEIKPE